jgi:hypothetical protein
MPIHDKERTPTKAIDRREPTDGREFLSPHSYSTPERSVEAAGAGPAG